METATVLHHLSAKQISDLFQTIQDQIADLKENFQPKEPAEYLTRAEVADILKCDLSTIHNWTKKGRLKAYGIGNRVYYKRNEVDAVLVAYGRG